jgi:Sulfate permease family
VPWSRRVISRLVPCDQVVKNSAGTGAALSSGMVVNGSLSKTAVNASAGARSQLSGLIVAALTIVTLIALTGLFEDLPEATLAAIVIAAVVELVDVPALVSMYRVYTRRLGREFGFVARPDFIAAVAALRFRSSTSPPPGCSPSSPRSYTSRAYDYSSPAMSARSGTSCVTSPTIPGSPTSIRRFKRPSTQPVAGGRQLRSPRPHRRHPDRMMIARGQLPSVASAAPSARFVDREEQM